MPLLLLALALSAAAASDGRYRLRPLSSAEAESLSAGPKPLGVESKDWRRNVDSAFFYGLRDRMRPVFEDYSASRGWFSGSPALKDLRVAAASAEPGRSVFIDDGRVVLRLAGREFVFTQDVLGRQFSIKYLPAQGWTLIFAYPGQVSVSEFHPAFAPGERLADAGDILNAAREAMGLLIQPNKRGPAPSGVGPGTTTP